MQNKTIKTKIKQFWQEVNRNHLDAGTRGAWQSDMEWCETNLSDFVKRNEEEEEAAGAISSVRKKVQVKQWLWAARK